MLRLRTHSRVYVVFTALVAVGLLSFFAVASLQAKDDAQDVKITATDFSFAPNTVNLTANHKVRLTITNTGTVLHDLTSGIPISNLVYEKVYMDKNETTENVEKGTLDVDFAPGETAIVTFTPTQTGTFEFHCDQPGHAAQGMTGSFTVSAATPSGK